MKFTLVHDGWGVTVIPTPGPEHVCKLPTAPIRYAHPFLQTAFGVGMGMNATSHLRFI